MAISTETAPRITGGAAAELFDEVVEIARFITISGSDTGFTVPDPVTQLSDHHILGFDAPGLIPDAPAIVYFRTTHSGNPRFSVRLNNDTLVVRTIAGEGVISWHEIAAPGTLRATMNELTLVVSTVDSVRFSDIVILYKSNQLTVRRPRELER